MPKYIIEFTSPFATELPEDKPGVDRDGPIIAQLLQRIKDKEIDCTGWHKDHGKNFGIKDSTHTVNSDETIYEIRLTIDDYDIELNEDLEAVQKYIFDAVALRPFVITNWYQRESEPVLGDRPEGVLTRTVLELREDRF